jgi:hypothetical protein
MVDGFLERLWKATGYPITATLLAVSFTCDRWSIMALLRTRINTIVPVMTKIIRIALNFFVFMYGVGTSIIRLAGRAGHSPGEVRPEVGGADAAPLRFGENHCSNVAHNGKVLMVRSFGNA